MPKLRTISLRRTEILSGLLVSLVIAAFGVAAWVLMHDTNPVSKEAVHMSGPNTPPRIISYNSIVADGNYMGWHDSESAKGWLQSWISDRQERYLEEARRFDDLVDVPRPWRSGTVLALPLRNKKYVKFFDEGVCAGFYTCQEHSFEFFKQEIGFYFVSVLHGEGSTWLAVSQTTGAVTDIANEPVFSPSGKRAFGYYNSMIDGAIFRIIRFDAEGAIIEFESLEPPFEASFKWIDENSITMRERDKPIPETYVLRSGKWAVTPINANYR